MGAETMTMPPLDRMFIDGVWCEPSTDAKIEIINPATEALYATVAEAQEDDINRAVAAARRAFDDGPWPRMTPRERAPYLQAIADGVNARGAELADAWTNQIGVLTGVANGVSFGMAELFRGHAAMAETFPFEEERPTTMGLAMGLVTREPVGVVGAIVPWNSPLVLLSIKIAPALLAGCTVVLKASPEAPIEAYLMAEIAREAGLPPGVLNVVVADRQASEALVRHPDVDKVSFTGSSAAGMRIASLCGERIARTTLELGGKSPAIILDDYDPQAAAAGLMHAVTLMSGQTCAALTRVIVSRQRHDALIDALVDRFRALKVGDPFDPTTELGPLAMQRQRSRVEQFIASGIDQGARLVTGGRRPPELDRGYYIEPTLFTEVDNGSAIAREEIFGPVMSVLIADDEEQAIEIANDTRFGLNSAVFTNDVERAYAVARRLRAGTVGHNGYHTDFALGFGGFKQSGIGREGGEQGLHAYLESKTILLDAELSRSDV
ncbi:aldehyde dehydrogenase [Sphingomonas sp.]|uniref:aldehyde dehydrogenase n=1 Tax=Sphingomonas sp. TaxID=28214 RepID=UPI003AFF73F6